MARYRTNKGERQGEVLRENAKTVIVRCEGKIIKRHKVKHGVREN